MSTTACKTDKLRQLDDEKRRAWNSYRDRIRELTGEDYELAEHDSWQQLQEELRGLEYRRRSLSSAPG